MSELDEARKRIEFLEAKVGTAYQIVGVLLAGPDGKDQLFFSGEGQAVLDYLSCDEAPDPLPFRYPKFNFDEEMELRKTGTLSQSVEDDGEERDT